MTNLPANVDRLDNHALLHRHYSAFCINVKWFNILLYNLRLVKTL